MKICIIRQSLFCHPLRNNLQPKIIGSGVICGSIYVTYLLSRSKFRHVNYVMIGFVGNSSSVHPQAETSKSYHYDCSPKGLFRSTFYVVVLYLKKTLQSLHGLTMFLRHCTQNLCSMYCIIVGIQ